jgi:hypothetical protein
MAEEYDEKFESDSGSGSGSDSGRSESASQRSGSEATNASVSAASSALNSTRLAGIASTLQRPVSAARARNSRPPPASGGSSRSKNDAFVRDDAAYYDDAADGGFFGDEEAERRAREATNGSSSSSDIRTASGALSSAVGVAKLRPADVASLRGLSGSAWNKKLEQLVSTVKGEKYSRAPAVHTSASLLIDSTADMDLGLGVVRGGAVDHRDPYSLGDAGARGSHFSAHPPAGRDNAKREHLDSIAASAALFNIAKVVDGAVYGSKAYAGRSAKHAQAVARRETGTRVLDKFAQDEEAMLAESQRLKRAVAQAKADLTTLSRERDLLDAHLVAQNEALDAHALKKGYVRLSGGVSNVASVSLADGRPLVGLPPPPPEKPRYEKLSTLQGAAGPSAASGKMTLEEQLLTLQVQQRSLRAQRASLQRQIDAAQDDVGVLAPHAEQDAEALRAEKRLLLDELHTLQQQMLADKVRHESSVAEQDAEVAALREQARVLQAQLDVQRQLHAGATLNFQQQQDRKTAMQAKISAVRKRLARYQSGM